MCISNVCLHTPCSSFNATVLGSKGKDGEDEETKEQEEKEDRVEEKDEAEKEVQGQVPGE